MNSEEKDIEEESEEEDGDNDEIGEFMKQMDENKDYDSDESEEEQMLKELLDKAVENEEQDEEQMASDNEGLSENDDMFMMEKDNADDDLDFSDFLDQSKMKRTKFGNTNDNVNLNNEEQHFAFGKKTKSLQEESENNNERPKPSDFGKNVNNPSTSNSNNTKPSSDKKPQSALKKERNKRKVTKVDDKFFSLADMESFLDREDQREERKIALERGEVKADSGDESSDYDMLYSEKPLKEEDRGDMSGVSDQLKGRICVVHLYTR